MLERDAAWTYHSVKQNVLISQLNGPPVSSTASFAPSYGLHLADTGQLDFQKVRGQGIVHAPPEIAFNCISDLDMLATWDGFSSEQQLIAEYSLGEKGLIRILYIRFNGIFPVSSRDICVCTIKRPMMPKKTQKKSYTYNSASPRNGSPANDASDPEFYVLTAFSVDHPSCPPSPGYVRAELRASGFIIRPHVNSSCSSITYILQFNAKGWVPTALSSMVSEYQPLRIAKIRDIVRTYQTNHNGSQKLTLANDASSTSTRFGWMQQCRGEAREEEDFIAAERQRLEEAGAELMKLKFKPARFSATSSAPVPKPKASNLSAPISRHHRSASSGSSKLAEPNFSSPRSGSASSETYRSHMRRNDYLHHSDGNVNSEGEGGETEWADQRPNRLRSLRPPVDYDVAISGDSDSDQGDPEVDSDDSSPFYDVSTDLNTTTLLQPGSDGYFIVLKMMTNDVESIKSMQLASQVKLESIEENLKNRSMQNMRLLDHLNGLKSFLVACMDKLRTFSEEHKAMEAMRLRLEQKWQTKLATIAQKLNNAQRGYWTPRRARKAILSRVTVVFFLVVVWPIIFIKLYKILQKPQKYIKRFLGTARIVADWLFPNIPFNSDI